MSSLGDPGADVTRAVHANCVRFAGVGHGVFDPLEVRQYVRCDLVIEGVEVDSEEDPRPVLESVVHGSVDRRISGGPSGGIVETGGVTAIGLVDGKTAKALVGDRL